MTEIVDPDRSETTMKHADLKPYGRRVLVQDPPAVQESGIIVPDSAKALKRSVVVALPDLKVLFAGVDVSENIDIGLRPGDVVLHRPDCGDEVDGGQRLIDLDCIRAVEK